LSDNAGEVAVKLLPVTFQCVGFWLSNEHPRMSINTADRVCTQTQRAQDLPKRNNCVNSRRNLTSNVSKIPALLIVKVKVTLVQALRLCTGRTALRGSRDIALLFLDHGTRRG